MMNPKSLNPSFEVNDNSNNDQPKFCQQGEEEEEEQDAGVSVTIPARRIDSPLDIHLSEQNEKKEEGNNELDEYGQSPGWFGYLTARWQGELVYRAYRLAKRKGQLEVEDLELLTKAEDVSARSEQFEALWESNSAKFKRIHDMPMLSEKHAYLALRQSLFTMEWQRFKWSGVLMLVDTLAKSSVPLLFNFLLESLAAISPTTDPFDEDMMVVYGWAASLILANIVSICLSQYSEDMVAKINRTWKSSLSTAVFDRCLQVRPADAKTFSSGQLISFLQIDVGTIANSTTVFHLLWLYALQLAISLGILYWLVGMYTFIGLGTILVALPVSTILTARIGGVFQRKAVIIDERTKVTNECIQGMQGVKMGVWEDVFETAILKFRSKEMKENRYFINCVSILLAAVDSIPAIATTAAIGFYAAFSGGPLNTAILFTVVNGFLTLKTALSLGPMAVTEFLRYRISAKRLAKFFASKSANADLAQVNDDPNAPAVIVVDGHFEWETQQDEKEDQKNEEDKGNPAVVNPSTTNTNASLMDINCVFKRNKITAIIGPVGSGKSSLCNAILGEMIRVQGSVTVSGAVAYAPQVPWLKNATLRDNILFGEDYDETRYRKVLSVCQLLHDLEMLPSGDQTAIGEKGINLSGGQKQRISVARAAYSKHPIVMLDDPLSALDPAVAAKLFRECIVDFMHGRSIVLVTNQLNFLPSCDSIVVLGGPSPSTSDSAGVGLRIVSQGTYEELSSSSNANIAQLLKDFNKATARGEEVDTETQDVPKDEEKGTAASRMAAALEGKAKDNLMEDEERNQGAVTVGDFLAVVRSYGYGGMWSFMSVMLIYTLGQVFIVFNSYWLSFWGDAVSTDYNITEPFNSLNIGLPANEEDMWYTVGYALTAVLLTLAALLPPFVIQRFSLGISWKLHESVLERTLAAPMSFFDTTPLGRIITRFTNDTGSVDMGLGVQLAQLATTFFELAGIMVVISLAAPLFLVSVPVLMSIYAYVVAIMRPANRDIKRIDALATSPVNAQMSETITGLSTIRAYGQQTTFKTNFTDKMGRLIRAKKASQMNAFWLNMRLGYISILVIVFAVGLTVYSVTSASTTQGQAALSLTYSLQVNRALSILTRSIGMTEAVMVSVERMVYYATQVAQEAARTSKNPPPSSWPTRGEIVVQDLKMRYRKDTPLVLKGVSFTINAGEHVGVVGRTGSGKSSLMLCLLRLVEPEVSANKRGPIIIDGVDICRIGLSELRRKVNIVPQSPVLFSGSIRKNLDPLQQHKDAELWTALECCNLKDFISGNSDKLDMEVAESGSNLSQGQRQLLTLARALLNKARILLLDEATSSVDFETDEIIQRTIRDKDAFRDCTALTIAHRINTVIDNDRILVLNRGLVTEFDAPQTLLSNPNSEFASMVRHHNEAK